MASNMSVQFRSPQNVLDAYVNRQVAAWSIWHGKQFMFKYEGESVDEGAAHLAELLQVLQQSQGIYTLRVYEDLDGKIKSNTPDDGSFNFRFQDAVGYMGGGQNNELLSELRAMKLEIEQLKSERDEEEPENKLGVLGDALEVPGVAQALAGLVPQLVAKLFGVSAPQALAGVPGAEIKTLADALAVLQAADPEFEIHMIQLATLARENETKFKSVVSMMAFM